MIVFGHMGPCWLAFVSAERNGCTGKKKKKVHIMHMCAWLYNRLMGWDVCVCNSPSLFRL